MRSRSLLVKLLVLAFASVALMFGASATAGAQDYNGPGDCPPPAGYEGHADYEHCDEENGTTTTTAAPTPTTEPPTAGGAGLPRTGGVVLLGLGAGVAVTGLALRRLITS